MPNWHHIGTWWEQKIRHRIVIKVPIKCFITAVHNWLTYSCSPYSSISFAQISHYIKLNLTVLTRPYLSSVNAYLAANIFIQHTHTKSISFSHSHSSIPISHHDCPLKHTPQPKQNIHWPTRVAYLHVSCNNEISQTHFGIQPSLTPH